jgi:hypothetical protein
MQVWDSTGHSYDSTLKAVVHLPQVQFFKLWTPSYTAAPVNGQVPQTAAASGGTVHMLTSAATFDREDLLITPTNAVDYNTKWLM